MKHSFNFQNEPEVFSFRPISVLDIRLALASEAPFDFSKAPFNCQACRESDLANCKRWHIAARLDRPSTSFGFSFEGSACTKVLNWLKEGRKLPEGEAVDFRFLMACVGGKGAFKRIWVTQLDFLSKRYTNWLLSKFKKNLYQLGADERMKDFSSEKLNCLRIYCRQNFLKFESLRLTSQTPPSLVFRNLKKKKKNVARQKKYFKFDSSRQKKISERKTENGKKIRTVGQMFNLKTSEGIEKEIELPQKIKEEAPRNDFFELSQHEEESHYEPSRFFRNFEPNAGGFEDKKRIEKINEFEKKKENELEEKLQKKDKFKEIEFPKESKEENLERNSNKCATNESLFEEKPYNLCKLKENRIALNLESNLPQLGKRSEKNIPRRVKYAFLKDLPRSEKRRMYKQVSQAVEELIGDLKGYREKLSGKLLESKNEKEGLTEKDVALGLKKVKELSGEVEAEKLLKFIEDASDKFEQKVRMVQ